MTRRIYYSILLVWTSIQLGYFIYGMVSRTNLQPLHRLSALGLVLYILAFELSSLSRRLRYIAFAAIPMTLLGILFKIQHWPGGGLMMYGGLATVITLGFLSTFKVGSQRILRSIIMLIPLLYFLAIVIPRHRGSGLFYISQNIVYPIIVFGCLILLIKSRKQTAGL